jgi:hypothetical protein
MLSVLLAQPTSVLSLALRAANHLAQTGNCLLPLGLLVQRDLRVRLEQQDLRDRRVRLDPQVQRDLLCHYLQQPQPMSLAPLPLALEVPPLETTMFTPLVRALLQTLCLLAPSHIPKLLKQPGLPTHLLGQTSRWATLHKSFTICR